MSVNDILENENVKLLIKTFDLIMPDANYELIISEYDITPEGFIVIDRIDIYKDGEFHREAKLENLIDHLPDYKIKFKRNDRD